MSKILCLIDTLGLGGGAERQMAGLAGFLHQKGLDITLATYHCHDSNNYLQKTFGISSVILKTRTNSLSKLMKVASFIRKNKFDVVIAYKDGATMLSCILKMIGMRFRLIVSERNVTQSLNRREQLKFFLYKWADVIVPNSETQGGFIQDHYPGLASKVHVITNFTDLDYFKPLCDDGVLTDCVRVLITARIAKQKNVIGFMKAIKIVQNKNIKIKVDWYGSVYSGQEQYGKECRKVYNDLEIENILTFHPATSDILEAYQRCNVFCLPSFYEGYPNVICEAMSCGKPVICSCVCDNPYIVKEGVNGFMFDPTNEADIAEKLITTSSLSCLELKQMGERSRSIAEKKFSKEVFVNQYIQLIHTISK